MKNLNPLRFLLALLIVVATGIDHVAAGAALSAITFTKAIGPLGFVASSLLPKFDKPADQGGGGDAGDTRDEPSMADQIGAAVARSVGLAVREAIVSDEVREALFGNQLDTSGGRQSAGRPNLGGATAGADRDKEDRAGLFIQCSKIFRGVVHGRHDIVNEGVQSLIDMGQYRDRGIETRDGYTTLTDADGGVFLPTVIADEVLRQQADMGAIYPNATVIPVGSGKLRYPNITAGLQAFWVAETGEAKARKAAFRLLDLDPEMLIVLTPWTVQMEDEAAAKFMPIVLEKLAEAFSVEIDNAAINGDGSATYGGVTGLLNNGSVGAFTAATGHTTPATLDWKDWVQLPFKSHYRARPFGSYIVHPDMVQYLLLLRDDQDRPIYRLPGDAENGLSANTLWGRPVLQSIYAPDPASVTTGTPFALYGNVKHLLIGEKHELQTEVFNTGSIKDVDDSTTINLLTQYYKVLRAAQGVDIQVGLPASFAVGSTA